MDQGPQGLWLGPNEGVEGYSLPQELEKACEAGYSSSYFIFFGVNTFYIQQPIPLFRMHCVLSSTLFPLTYNGCVGVKRLTQYLLYTVFPGEIIFNRGYIRKNGKCRYILNINNVRSRDEQQMQGFEYLITRKFSLSTGASFQLRRRAAALLNKGRNVWVQS